jgi:hypothetical protein
VSLRRSGVLFFAPTTISDGHEVRGEKPSKQEGHPDPSLRGYAPRRGRFGRRAGGPTIFSGPSRSSTGTYRRSRSPV